jgi:hypothetical protein
MSDYSPSDFDPISAEPEAEERYWTVRRILFAIVILITLIAFLIYTLVYGWVTTHPLVPQPTPTPIVLDQV